MRKYIVGNWKMNGTSADLPEISAIAAMAEKYVAVDSAICLPATLVNRAVDSVNGFQIGGQDCHIEPRGAHTGCISANMLADAGASLVIVGHSERRCDQHETDSDICAKATAAHKAGLSVIVCVGETLTERDEGQALSVVIGQLEGSLPNDASGEWLAIAYEPVWAIGTGRIPEKSDVEQIHAAIRTNLTARFGAKGSAIRILYGGSMSGDNAANLLAIQNVDGGLVGGASLSGSKFEPILAAASELGE